MPPRRKLGSLLNYNFVGDRQIGIINSETPAPTSAPTLSAQEREQQRIEREQQRIAYQQFLDQEDRERRENEAYEADLLRREAFEAQQARIIQESQNATRRNAKKQQKKQQQKKNKMGIDITGLAHSRISDRRFL
jgi:hypothetical protein